MRENRAPQLQFLRCCAFLFIFLYHTGTYQYSWFPGSDGAASSVSFFILLSGFVSGYSSFGRDIPCSGREVARYLRKKLKKVYPLYFVTTVYAVSASKIPSLVAGQSSEELAPLLLQLLKNLLLIQSWFPSEYFSFNGVGWFLSTIMFLYLLNIPMRAAASRIAKSGKSDVLFAAVFAGSFLLTLLYNYLVRTTDFGFTQYILPAARVGEYACGMALGCLACSLGRRIKTGAPAAAVFSLLETGALFFWVFWMYVGKADWQSYVIHWFYPNCLLLFVFSFGQGIFSALFRKKPLRFLGDISFECFLLHQLVISVYRKNSKVKADTDAGRIFSILFCLVLTVLVAALVHHARPARDTLRPHTSAGA